MSVPSKAASSELSEVLKHKIESRTAKVGVIGMRQRQTDVAHSNHATFGGAGFDLVFEHFRQFGACSFRWHRHGQLLFLIRHPEPATLHWLVTFAVTAARLRYQATVRRKPSRKSTSGR